MCDLLRIEVTLLHPEDDGVHTPDDIKGVLSITSGTADIPGEGQIDPDEVISAIASSLDIIGAGMAREWQEVWARRRELAARDN